jgi:hypothetical protein
MWKNEADAKPFRQLQLRHNWGKVIAVSAKTMQPNYRGINFAARWSFHFYCW